MIGTSDSVLLACKISSLEGVWMYVVTVPVHRGQICGYAAAAPATFANNTPSGSYLGLLVSPSETIYNIEGIRMSM